jgi:hypothetical protein
MNIIVKANSFIRSSSDGELTTDDLTETVVSVDYDFGPNNIVDPYGLPLFRYINDQVVPVTSIEEWHTDPIYWQAYLKKLKDQIDGDIESLTNDELKDIYDNGDQYTKAMMYQELKNSTPANQPSVNLLLEVGMRVMAEWFYIKEVEQREPTTEETAGFHQALTTIHNHSVDMGLPISTTSWFQAYFATMLAGLDSIRTASRSKRLYVTGTY